MLDTLVIQGSGPHLVDRDDSSADELESMRWECKAKFRSSQAGVCKHCGSNIMHDMARHVSN